MRIRDLRTAAVLAAVLSATRPALASGNSTLEACPGWCLWECADMTCMLYWPCSNTCDEYCSYCGWTVRYEGFMGGCSYDGCNADYCECSF
jgi:hypothetical protein